MEKPTPPAELGSHPNVAQPPAAHAADGAHQAQQHSGPVPSMNPNVHQGNAPAPATTYATPLNGLGKDAAIIDCPFCKQRTRTRVEAHSSSMTILTGVGIGCLCICLACLPCILGWFEDVEHFCTNCNQRVALVADGRAAQAIYPQEPQQGYSMGQPQQYGQQPPAAAQSPPPQQQQQQQPPVGQPAQSPAPPQYSQ